MQCSCVWRILMMLRIWFLKCKMQEKDMNIMILTWSTAPSWLHPSLPPSHTHTHAASFTERQQSANLSFFTTGSDIIQSVINFNETLYGGETYQILEWGEKNWCNYRKRGERSGGDTEKEQWRKRRRGHRWKERMKSNRGEMKGKQGGTEKGEAKYGMWEQEFISHT